MPQNASRKMLLQDMRKTAVEQRDTKAVLQFQWWPPTSPAFSICSDHRRVFSKRSSLFAQVPETSDLPEPLDPPLHTVKRKGSFPHILQKHLNAYPKGHRAVSRFGRRPPTCPDKRAKGFGKTDLPDVR